LWWVPGGENVALGDGNGSGIADDEKHLAVLTGKAEVYIWDVGQRRCVKRCKDEGGYRGAGRVLAGSGGVGSGRMAIGLVFFFPSIFLCNFPASPFPRHFTDIFSFLLLSAVLPVDLSMSTIPTLFPRTMAMTGLRLYLELQS
jgi:hypothetical protein